MKCKHFTCHSCHDVCAHLKSLVEEYKAIPKKERLVERQELREKIWEAALKLVPDDTAQRT